MSRRRYGGKIRNGRDRHHGMMGARSFWTVEIVQNSAPTTAKGCPRPGEGFGSAVQQGRSPHAGDARKLTESRP